MAQNIFRIKNIRNEQTKNQNRFLIRFIGLNTVLERAANSPFAGVQAKYNALLEAAKSRSPYTDQNVSDGQKMADTLELGLLSATIPDIMIESVDMFKFNDSIKQTTKFAPMEDITMTFYDYVNGSATAAFHIWKGLIADKFTGAMGFKQDYILQEAEYLIYGPEAPAYDELNLPTGFDEIPYLEKWKLVNLRPKQIDIGEHSYETGDARKITVTMECDSLYPVDFGYYGTDENGRPSVINNPANEDAFRNLL